MNKLFLFGLLSLACLSLSTHAKERSFLSELDLTDEQAQEIKALRETHRGEMQAKRKMLRSKSEALQSALQADTSDAQLKVMFEALQSVRAETDKLRFEQTLEIRKILNPEQRKKMKSYVFDRRSRKFGGRGSGDAE